MASFRKATSEQRDYFANYDLICPLTEEVAQSLMNYIEQERNGGTREERCAAVREAQKIWINHRVFHVQNGQDRGVVRHLTARSPQMMRDAYASARALRNKGMGYEPSRFMAVIEESASKVVVVGLEHLSLQQ